MLNNTIDLENWMDDLMLLSGTLWLLVLVLAIAQLWYVGLIVSFFFFVVP